MSSRGCVSCVLVVERSSNLPSYSCKTVYPTSNQDSDGRIGYFASRAVYSAFVPRSDPVEYWLGVAQMLALRVLDPICGGVSKKQGLWLSQKILRDNFDKGPQSEAVIYSLVSYVCPFEESGDVTSNNHTTNPFNALPPRMLTDRTNLARTRRISKALLAKRGRPLRL